MSDSENHIETEVESYVAQLDGFITQTKDFQKSEAHVDVVRRFVRDCDTLKSDLYAKSCPTMEDMNDYADRCASLDVQFHNLKNEHK
jgi:hypothetical protein